MAHGTECYGFCRKVRQRLWDCQQRTEFCDMYLEAEGGDRVPCHKVVVASSSPSLYNMMRHLNYPGVCLSEERSAINPEASVIAHTGISTEHAQIPTAQQPTASADLKLLEASPDLGHLKDSAMEISTDIRTMDDFTDVRLPEGSTMEISTDPKGSTMEISTDPKDSTMEISNGVRTTESSATVKCPTDCKLGISIDMKNTKTVQMQTLKLSEVTSEGLKHLVRFMYLGNVEEIGVEVIELCQRFQFCEPIRLCDDGLNKSKDSTPTKMCLRVKNGDGKEEHVDAESFEEKSHLDVTDNGMFEGTSEFIDNAKSLSVRVGTAFKRCTKRIQPRKRARVAKDSGMDARKLSSAKRSRTAPLKKHLRSFVSAKHKSVAVHISSDHTHAVQKEDTEKGDCGGTEMDSLKVGKKQTAGNMGMTCRTCDIQFESVETYREHRNKFHKDYHKCDECEASLKKPKALKAHKVCKHYKEGMPQPTWYHCMEPGCTYTTIYRWTIDSHHTSKHTSDKLICETCGSRFTTKWALKMHVDKIHNGVLPTITCGKCDKKFYTPALLAKHVDRVHNKALHYLCDQCPYMGFTKGAVTDHQFRQHGVRLPGSKPSFTCPHCAYNSPKKREMTDHIERHTAQTYKCDHCDKVFPASRDLKTHYNLVHSHRKAVLHPCPHVGCKYTSKYGPMKLQDHISRMHERKDYKPWGCEECGYKTNVKGNLTLHLRNIHGISVPTRRKRINKLTPGGSTGVSTENPAQTLGGGTTGDIPSGNGGHQANVALTDTLTENLQMIADTCSDTILLEKGLNWSAGTGSVQYANSGAQENAQ